MKLNCLKEIKFDLLGIMKKEEWYFSVVDIVGVLTESKNPRDYWYRVKKEITDEKSELSTSSSTTEVRIFRWEKVQY